MTGTRHSRSVSQGNRHNEEDHTKDASHDPNDCGAPHIAGLERLIPHVPYASGNFVSLSLLIASSSLYSFISPMRNDGGKEVRVEEACTKP